MGPTQLSPHPRPTPKELPRPLPRCLLVAKRLLGYGHPAHVQWGARSGERVLQVPGLCQEILSTWKEEEERQGRGTCPGLWY